MPSRARPSWFRVWRRGVRRHLGETLLALPALLAALAIALVAVAALMTSSRDGTIQHYARGAARQLQARDYPAALVCHERLVQLGSERPEHRFGLVQVLEALGKPRRAEAIARELAPTNRPGYLPAQLWLGRRLCVLAGRSSEAARDAELHLRQVPDDHPSAVEAHTLLGWMFFASGKPALAEQHLEKASPERPELLFLLTQVYLKLGKTETAREAARRAVRTFHRQSATDPSDVQARVHWATATMILEDFAGTETILEEGLKRRDDPRFHQTLAILYQVWSDALARKGQVRLGERLELVERGLEHDPDNVELLVRLARTIPTGGPWGERARALLRALLASGKARAGIHFALGIDAWEQGRRAAARSHWEHALRLSPRFAAVANNLAWLLAHEEPPELDRALQLINLALDRRPNDPMYRDTRGRILLKMGRWDDALADLETALAGNPTLPGLHGALAEAYDHLGDPAMAAEHRRLARNQPQG